MRRRPAFTALPAGAMLLAVLYGALCAGSSVRAAEKRLQVQGRIHLDSGGTIAGWPVQIIGTQRYIEFGRTTSGGGSGIVGRTTSDPGGYYAFDLPRDPRYQFWFVRFLDPDHFDAVRHLPPRDVDISTQVRRGRLASVDLTVRSHPDWAEVQRRIAAAGGVETPRGRVLRSLGLPEKVVEPQAGGEEEWWYFTKGVVYNLRGSEVAGTRRFEPVKPPETRAEGAGPGGR